MKTVTALAKELGITRMTVHQRLARLGLKPRTHGRTRVLTERECNAVERIPGKKK